MLDKIFGEILNEAALRTGKELGRELRNFFKVSRGEASWDELTHVQQTMFLGGDRAEYERIRTELRRAHRGGSNESSPPRNSAHGLRQPFFDYDRL